MQEKHSQKIERMFDSIAADYDRLNHLMSLGIDRSWRRKALKQIVVPGQVLRVLDAACGTGDFSIAIARKAESGSRVTGVDLSEKMLAVMQEKLSKEGLQDRIRTFKGNCEELPFPEDSFDRVTIAFGIRNVEKREVALKEFLRVLKPGGKLVILELSEPSAPLLRRIYNVYFDHILPFVGGTISGDRVSYRYLPASVHRFPGPERWMGLMGFCGFKQVTHKAFSAGICRMYTGTK